MTIYVTRVNGLLHHATSHAEEHHAYVAELREASHDVTTEEQASDYVRAAARAAEENQ